MDTWYDTYGNDCLPLLSYDCQQFSLSHSLSLDSLLSSSSYPPMSAYDGVCSNATVSFSETHEFQKVSQSPPSYIKWSQSFSQLLDDEEGARLFKEYLTEENAVENFLFYFAVNGFKKQEVGPKRNTLAKVINRTFINATAKYPLKISEETRQAIVKICGSDSISSTMFDQAHEEIRSLMKDSIYPNFLRSDLYIQYVASYSAASPSITPGADAEASKSSSSTSSVRNTAVSLPTLPEESELSLEAEDHVPNLISQSIITSSTRTQSSKHKIPNEHGYYHTYGGRTRNHSYAYSSLAPAGSTNDSELQSLSSDAPTDDSMSITDSSVDYSQPTNKRFQHMARRERRNMKSTAAKNGPQVLPYIHLPPRTQSEMNNDPNIFAEILITRLEKLKKEQDREESAEKKLSEKLRKCEVDAGLEPSSQARLRSMIVATQDPVLDDTEDMLEAHCSRVFHDGCYSPGRCHSCGAANTLPAGGFSSQKKPRRVRTTNTGGRKCETSSSGKSTSSGVDSGVYDGTSHHSSESRSSDKQQMVRDWVRQSSFEPGRHKPKHNSNRFASLSPGPIPRITSFNRKSPGVQNSRSGSLERQAYIVGGNLSVYAPNIRPTDDAFSGSLRGQILPSGTLANSAPETECLLDPTKQRSEERKKSQKKDKRVSTGKQPSSNNSVISTTNVETVVAYYFCQEPIPYRTTVPFREVTLAHFKSLMTRRGRFRYFFKRHSNEIEPGGVVQEEIRDDTALLPLFEGKVIGRVEKIE